MIRHKIKLTDNAQTTDVTGDLAPSVHIGGMPTNQRSGFSDTGTFPVLDCQALAQAIESVRLQILLAPTGNHKDPPSEHGRFGSSHYRSA